MGGDGWTHWLGPARCASAWFPRRSAVEILRVFRESRRQNRLEEAEQFSADATTKLLNPPD